MGETLSIAEIRKMQRETETRGLLPRVVVRAANMSDLYLDVTEEYPVLVEKDSYQNDEGEFDAAKLRNALSTAIKNAGVKATLAGAEFPSVTIGVDGTSVYLFNDANVAAAEAAESNGGEVL